MFKKLWLKAWLSLVALRVVPALFHPSYGRIAGALTVKLAAVMRRRATLVLLTARPETTTAISSLLPLPVISPSLHVWSFALMID